MDIILLISLLICLRPNFKLSLMSWAEKGFVVVVMSWAEIQSHSKSCLFFFAKKNHVFYFKWKTSLIGTILKQVTEPAQRAFGPAPIVSYNLKALINEQTVSCHFCVSKDATIALSPFLMLISSLLLIVSVLSNHFASLISAFGDWTWGLLCQLGEL
jgi:hypothetical protein